MDSESTQSAGQPTSPSPSYTGNPDLLVSASPKPGEPSRGGSADSGAPVSWSWDDATSTYVSTGTPPECPSPLIDEGALVDVSDVRSKLMPGQLRDGEYLVNGTYRWSSEGQRYPKKVVVRMPFDGYVTAAWQFTLGGNYLFGVNLVHPCGKMIRLSKMSAPGPEFKAAVLDKLGPAKEKDSRETFFNPGIWVPKGTVITTNVGVKPPAQHDLEGAFLDVAALDLRAPNAQIPPDFTGPQAAPQYIYWFHCFYQEDFLAGAEQEKVSAIPLGNKNPKSDVCVDGG